MPKKKKDTFVTEESLRKSANKAKQALTSLDEEYLKLDSAEQALSQIMDSLIKEETCLIQALQQQEQEAAEVLKPQKSPPLKQRSEQGRRRTTSQQRKPTAAPTKNAALERLELALMASDSSSDETSQQDK